MLRRWREQVARCSQVSAAQQLGVPPSLRSGWESGRETVGNERFGDLGGVLAAGGTLAALLDATGTAKGFAARSDWWFNLQGRSCPRWTGFVRR